MLYDFNRHLDGFCKLPKYLKSIGFPIGTEVIVDIPANHPAHENLNGYKGIVVGSHFTQGGVAVHLRRHPNQVAAYFDQEDLRVLPTGPHLAQP